MSATLHADENGILHIPAALLPGSAPLAAYEIKDQEGQTIIARKVDDLAKAPFWERATPEERVAALREWLTKARTPVGLSDYAVSRESMYD